MTEHCYWFRCPRCKFVWWQHFQQPIIYAPFLSRCTCSCPKCNKRAVVAYEDEPSWHG